MCSFANSVDPDEMPHNATFHQVLHCSLSLNRSTKKYTIFLEIITCDHSKYTMEHPDFVLCSFMEKYIGLKKISISGLPLWLERVVHDMFISCITMYCLFSV